MNMIYRNGRATPPAGPSDSLMQRFGAFVGQKFRDETEKMQKSLDGRFAKLRNDYLVGARSRASELARNEVDGRIEAALESHRAERVALQRQVEALRDEVEKMRQQMGSEYR